MKKPKAPALFFIASIVSLVPIVSIVPMILIVPMVLGCTSLIQKTGEILDHDVPKEKTLSIFRDERSPRSEVREVVLENGERAVIISGSAYSGLTLRGTNPKDGYFSITQAEILSTHVHGWNNFTLELSGDISIGDNSIGEDFAGGISVSVNGNTSTLNMPISPKGILISEGKIRYKESRITGADALVNLRNRRERILAITEWMATQGPEQKPRFSSQREFEAYWKPRLFPELVSRRERPEQYDERDAQWVQGSGVRWNDNYTKAVFPNELWELRNSGALLRDWEEAASWIFIEYSWDAIATYYDGMELKKIK